VQAGEEDSQSCRAKGSELVEKKVIDGWNVDGGFDSQLGPFRQIFCL
jgi:hypothetical protein